MIEKYLVGVNLAWSHNRQSNEEIFQQYQSWITKCSSQNIGVVRIFVTRWSLNALFDDTRRDLLNQIISFASERKIEVVLVINHFTDFIRHHERDLASDEYIWRTFPLKTTSLTNFFDKPSEEYVEIVRRLLADLRTCSNIQRIELFNEIDLVDVSRKILVSWCNQLINTLDLQDRFDFFISVAHQNNYHFFKNHCSVPVDIHFYNYPFENAFQSLEDYKKISDNLLFGEYAKFSDEPRLERCDARSFFCSGLWGGFFLKLKTSPMHWWWEELLQNESCANIMNTFHNIKLAETVPFVSFEIKNIQRTKQTNISNANKGKLQTRLTTLIRNPRLVKREYAAIAKFVKKHIYKLFDEQLFVRAYRGSEIYIYCEPKNCQTVIFDLTLHPEPLSPNPHAVLIDLFTGKESALQIETGEGMYEIKGCKISHNHLIKIINGK